MFGIYNTSNDVEMIKSLANELGIENIDIKNTFRIKAKQRTNNFLPLPLNVEFHCEEDKYVFLNKCIREKLKICQKTASSMEYQLPLTIPLKKGRSTDFSAGTDWCLEFQGEFDEYTSPRACSPGVHRPICL